LQAIQGVPGQVSVGYGHLFSDHGAIKSRATQANGVAIGWNAR
jgi:hypothetical protein